MAAILRLLALRAALQPPFLKPFFSSKLQTMKHILFAFSLFLFSLSSCKKENAAATDDLYKDAPRSDMPAEIAPANWRYGSLSALGIYDNRGNHIANAQDALREYKVTSDGYVEFVQYLAVNSSNCYSMAYTHLKGTMKWEAPNKLTWTPVKGEFESRFTCSGTQSTRTATQADLDRSKSVWWYRLEDLTYSGTKDYLVLYTDPAMQSHHQEFAYKLIK